MLRIERRGGVEVITLERPEARNALHPDLIARLSDTLATTNDDDGIRVVILTVDAYVRRVTGSAQRTR